jgi:hypothetical protein
LFILALIIGTISGQTNEAPPQTDEMYLRQV